MSNNIIAKCISISKACFINIPYKAQTTIEMYASNGFANKATGICHFCTIDTRGLMHAGKEVLKTN